MLEASDYRSGQHEGTVPLGNALLIHSSDHLGLLIERLWHQAWQGLSAMDIAEGLDHAAAVLSAHPYDIVFIDPELADHQSAEEVLTTLSTITQLPFIVITGPVGHEVALDYIRWGAEEVLSWSELSAGRLARAALLAAARVQSHASGMPSGPMLGGVPAADQDNDPTVIINQDGIVLSVRQLACEMLTMTPDALIGLDLMACLERQAIRHGRRLEVVRVADCVWKGAPAHLLRLVDCDPA